MAERRGTGGAPRGCPPRDWIYEECSAAFEAIRTGELTPDSAHQYADGRVEIYTKDLAQWYAEFCLSDTFAHAKDAAEYYGPPEDPFDVNRTLMQIQFCAIARIATAILEAHDNENARATG